MMPQDIVNRLIGQSIQWQRDAEIKLLKLRAATIRATTIEECARVAEDQEYGTNPVDAAAAIRALKEQQ